MNEWLADVLEALQRWPVSFLWPAVLWSLLALPALVLMYWWLMGRRRHVSVRLASLSIVREALGRGPGWRRHVPPLLLLLALAILLLASARPVARLVLPSTEQTIVLAMDVSASMRATDVEPNRLAASQAAAKAFLADLPRHVKVGIVAFAGTAQVVQPITLSREDLLVAIDKFQLQRATAIGSAIVVALSELFPDQGIDVGQLSFERGKNPFGPQGRAIDQPLKAKKPFTPVAPGSYGSAAVILLTDGQRTTGFDTEEAAQMAADRGVRVYTVGVGTVAGEVIGFEGWSMRVRLDEETLQSVARMTQGEYFYAGTADNLKQVYEALSARLTVREQETEISGLLALLGALLVLLSAGLSLFWFHRIA